MALRSIADSHPEEERKREQVAATVARIWEQSRGKIVARVDTLERATLAILEDGLNEDLRREAEREAHKLAGSLATFGFPEGSRLAREMEQTFLGSASLDQIIALRLSEQVLELRRELEQPPDGQSRQQLSEDGTTKSLLVVDGDKRLTERLSVDAPAKGLSVHIESSLAGARTAITHRRPDVVLLSLGISSDIEESLSLISELSAFSPPIPVLVRTTDDTLASRLHVVRSGGGGFLPKSMPPAQILDAVTQAIKTLKPAETKVLAVDDDPEILSILTAVMDTQAIELKTLEDPLQFWETLESTTPDLLVLDVDMPHATGIELCRVLRSDPHWSSLPVLFLTSRKDSETVAKMFEAGADDYVCKPIVGEELITRVRNRLERTKLQRSVAESDPLTGLSNRSKSTEVLNQWLALAEIYRQPVCLGVLELDYLTDINDQRGHAAGDRVLRRLAQFLQGTFRDEDVVARWDGATFVVGMYGTERDQGVQRLTEVLGKLCKEVFTEDDHEEWKATFSAGVGQFPEDGTDLPALYRAAEEALKKATDLGRGLILPYGWKPGQSSSVEKIDVLMVDDDETLASLVVHALENRGYAVRWLNDGQEALDSLTGVDPKLAARLVLLDVDLPGMDGIGVLRSLAEQKLLQRTRVIMLTLRSTEREVMSTLELGAFDHVAKPFSMQILLERVRRALQA